MKKVGIDSKNEMSVAEVLANTVYVIILIPIVVAALNVLKISAISEPATLMLNNTIISYLPQAVSGLLMLGITILLANYVQKIILKAFPDSKGTSLLAKVFIIILGVFITLYQLGIASQMVNNAFLIILGAVGVAFAVAFGLGGR